MSRVVTNDRRPNFRNDDGRLYLIRCFNCDGVRGRENYLPMVATGRCAWCGWEETFKAGGSSGQREADAPTHKTPPEGAQRLATTNTGGQEWPDSCPPTFSDPGDGYDSAIRWHADFERGAL